MNENIFLPLILAPNIRDIVATGQDHVEVFHLQEYALYGSKRLGLQKNNQPLSFYSFTGSSFDADGYFSAKNNPQTIAVNTAPAITPFIRGQKLFELSNHLGNVLAIVSDRKLQVADASLSLGHYFTADIHLVQDYYPYGMTMPGRTVLLSTLNPNGPEYRYGFQGQEEDGEMYGGAVSYKYRVHDPRLGRFLSLDPLAPEYPWNSPYAFSENKLIAHVELEGLESVYAADGTIDHTLEVGDAGRGPTQITSMFGNLNHWIKMIDDPRNSHYFEHITVDRYNPNNPAYTSLNLNVGNTLYNVGTYEVDGSASNGNGGNPSNNDSGPEGGPGLDINIDTPWWLLPVGLYMLLPEAPDVPYTPDGSDGSDGSDDDSPETRGLTHFGRWSSVVNMEATGKFYPSNRPELARGPGQYATSYYPEMVGGATIADLLPWEREGGMISRWQLSHRLFGGSKFSWRRIQNYQKTEAFIQFDTTGLQFRQDTGRFSYRFYRQGLDTIDLKGRIIRIGKTDNSSWGY